MKNRYKIKINLTEETTVMINGEYKLKANAFDITPFGKWLGYSNYWHLTDEDKINLNLDFKVNKSINLQDKTLYRFPNLDLPRQKVDLLKEKYNIKIIRDINKADVCVVSNKLFDNLLDLEWGLSVNFTDFFQILKQLKDGNHLTDAALNKCKELIEITGSNSMIKIMLSGNGFSYTYGNSPDTLKINFANNITDICNNKNFKPEIEKNRDIILNDKNLNAYSNIQKYKTHIVYDTEISNIIDKQLAVIDNSEYENICKMIKSNDRDNRSLALEMLANCNIDKSFDIVSGIFYWEYDWLKDTNNWNTANVKTFRKRMEAYKGGHNTTSIHSFNYYLRLLAKDKKLTQYAVDKTKKKLRNSLLNYYVGDSADVFKINLDSLYIIEELKNQILTND